MYSKCRSTARDCRVEIGWLTRGVVSGFVWLKEKGGQQRESEGGAWVGGIKVQEQTCISQRQ